ncbi:MAG TPA: translation initiation factor IF-3 [Spirillospora sp.]|nr:translation initiation factor IF-3 [Spirillospora sp.]
MTPDSSQHSLCKSKTTREGGKAISSTEFRINDEIRVREVRVITDTNENLGVMSIQDALALAESRGMDLVEVSPGAKPPVCRVMDFGKFQYERQRRERKARKQQKTVEIKEIQLRPKTDDHHLSFKVRDARKWIEKGMKVKVRVRFRGRERDYPDIARERMEGIAAELKDVAVVEQVPSMEGNNMLMVLAPLTDKK